MSIINCKKIGFSVDMESLCPAGWKELLGKCRRSWIRNMQFTPPVYLGLSPGFGSNFRAYCLPLFC